MCNEENCSKENVNLSEDKPELEISISSPYVMADIVKMLILEGFENPEVKDMIDKSCMNYVIFIPSIESGIPIILSSNIEYTSCMDIDSVLMTCMDIISNYGEVGRFVSTTTFINVGSVMAEYPSLEILINEGKRQGELIDLFIKETVHHVYHELNHAMHMNNYPPEDFLEIVSGDDYTIEKYEVIADEFAERVINEMILQDSPILKRIRSIIEENEESIYKTSLFYLDFVTNS